MPEPVDACRPVTLPTGETVAVRGTEPLGERGGAALADLVGAVRAALPPPSFTPAWTRPAGAWTRRCGAASPAPQGCGPQCSPASRTA